MFVPKLCVVLPPADRVQLAAPAKGTTPQKLAIRARILLQLADIRPAHVATRLAVSRNHVHCWVRRYATFGVTGVVRDAARPGRKKRITPEHRRGDRERDAYDDVRADALEPGAAWRGPTASLRKRSGITGISTGCSPIG